MKERRGFVSNSSSSSFIVKTKLSAFDSGTGKKAILVDDDGIEKLKEFGFVKTLTTHPSNYESRKNEDVSDDIWESCGSCFGYYVVCNQDEVIEFLVKNNIPFIASCQYGHETVIYHKNDISILTVYNYGLEAETYSQNTDIEKLRDDYQNRPVTSMASIKEHGISDEELIRRKLLREK